MGVELRNIPGRPAPEYFSHVAVARGERVIHLAGQVGTDDRGDMVPGGLGAQAERALLNIGLALEAAGASPSDLVKLTVYVVDWDPAKFEELGGGLLAARASGSWTDVPVTLVGVQALFTPEMLVEIEGVAVAADA